MRRFTAQTIRQQLAQKTTDAREKDAIRSNLLDALVAIRREHKQLPDDLTKEQKAIHLLRFAKNEYQLTGTVRDQGDLYQAAKLIGNLTHGNSLTGRISPQMQELLRIIPLDNFTNLDDEHVPIRRAILNEHPINTKRKAELAKELGIGIPKLNSHIKAMQHEKLID